MMRGLGKAARLFQALVMLSLTWLAAVALGLVLGAAVVLTRLLGGRRERAAPGHHKRPTTAAPQAPSPSSGAEAPPWSLYLLDPATFWPRPATAEEPPPVEQHPVEQHPGTRSGN